MDIIMIVVFNKFFVITLLISLDAMSGIPILRQDICTELEVSFTCIVNESMILHWEIDFLSNWDIDRVAYLPTDPIGQHLVATNRGTGVAYHYNLTSKSPLTSTLSTSAPTDLSGAIVSCSNGIQNSADTATLALNDPPRNLTVVMSTRNMDPEDPYLNVVLQWIDQTFDAILNQSYIITLDTADSGDIFHTTNTSIQLNLFYDQDYNISVVARNCIGSSSPATIHIRITQFDNCALIFKDDHDIVVNSCLLNATTTTMDELQVTVSNFTIDSTLVLATQKHGTIDPLVPSMIASHLFLSAFSCTVGILIGFLLYRCYISKRAQQTTTSPPEPVYTEIALSANEAYGKVNP